MIYAREMSCTKGACRQNRRAAAKNARVAAAAEREMPDAEDSHTQDRRDAGMMRAASARGAGRERMTPRTAGDQEGVAWGGALRRMAATHIAPSREDVQRFVSVPGRYVPIGFAKYASPVVRPEDYEYYRLSGWRVAVPRSIPGDQVKDLLYRIFYYGPQSAGYLRIGDSLVPAILGPGDRNTLAGNSLEYDTYPLSP